MIDYHWCLNIWEACNWFTLCFSMSSWKDSFASLWLLSLEGYEQQTSNILQMPYIVKAASFFQKEAVVAQENEGVLERSGKQQKAPDNFEWYLRQWMMKRIGRVNILASHLTVCPSMFSSTVVNTGQARSCFLFYSKWFEMYLSGEEVRTRKYHRWILPPQNLLALRCVPRYLALGSHNREIVNDFISLQV